MRKAVVKCYSVCLKSLESISDKAFKVVSYDGSIDVIPKSQVYGEDIDVLKSDSYWISAWILSKKNVTYSKKKEAYFDLKYERVVRSKADETIVFHHKPDPVSPKNNYIESLRK